MLPPCSSLLLFIWWSSCVSPTWHFLLLCQEDFPPPFLLLVHSSFVAPSPLYPPIAWRRLSSITLRRGKGTGRVREALKCLKHNCPCLGVGLCVLCLHAQGCALFFLFAVSCLEESCSGSQNHCVGLLAKEKLGREKLEEMTEYRLSFRLCKQCVSALHSKPYFSDQKVFTSPYPGCSKITFVTHLWTSEISMGNWLIQGILSTGTANLCSQQGGLGWVCHPAWAVDLRHTLCIYHCIMVLFIQGSNPPQCIIMHSLLSSQNIIISLWGWVMFTGWARAWLSLSGPGCPIFCQDFFFFFCFFLTGKQGSEKWPFSWHRHQLYISWCRSE